MTLFCQRHGLAEAGRLRRSGQLGRVLNTTDMDVTPVDHARRQSPAKPDSRDTGGRAGEISRPVQLYVDA